MDEECVDMFDVLSAMAESLVETQAVFMVPPIPDKRVEIKLGGKPPREIFYRKTLTYSTQLPPPVQTRRCTCLYLCTGGSAVIKCFSCAIYDPTGVGFFCQLCFNARHPWYRVPHLFADIDKDESIEYTMKVAHRRAEALRFESEGQDILQSLRDDKENLNLVGDDERVDNNLRHAGRRTTDLEKNLRDMRRKIRKEIRATGQHLEMSDDEACCIIQRVFKGFRIRRLVSLMYVERIVCVWDTLQARDFYFDKATQRSSWTPPKLLLRAHLDKLQYMKEISRAAVWACKTSQSHRHKRNAKDAQGVIRGFLRCVRARQVLLQRAVAVYRRVWDEDSSTYYYANLHSGTTTWNKPKVLLSCEPPVFVEVQQGDTGEEAATGAAQNRRSPRVNRA